jgi:hypothetical protein
VKDLGEYDITPVESLKNKPYWFRVLVYLGLAEDDLDQHTAKIVFESIFYPLIAVILWWGVLRLILFLISWLVL